MALTSSAASRTSGLKAKIFAFMAARCSFVRTYFSDSDQELLKVAGTSTTMHGRNLGDKS
jgi:hypothetical protein